MIKAHISRPNDHSSKCPDCEMWFDDDDIASSENCCPVCGCRMFEINEFEVGDDYEWLQ